MLELLDTKYSLASLRIQPYCINIIVLSPTCYDTYLNLNIWCTLYINMIDSLWRFLCFFCPSKEKEGTEKDNSKNCSWALIVI